MLLFCSAVFSPPVETSQEKDSSKGWLETWAEIKLAAAQRDMLQKLDNLLTEFQDALADQTTNIMRLARLLGLMKELEADNNQSSDSDIGLTMHFSEVWMWETVAHAQEMFEHFERVEKEKKEVIPKLQESAQLVKAATFKLSLDEKAGPKPLVRCLACSLFFGADLI